MDSHPLHDGRVNRHISYLNSTHKYKIFRLNLIFNSTKTHLKYHEYVSLFQLTLVTSRVKIFRQMGEFLWSLFFHKKYSVNYCIDKLGIDCNIPTIIHVHDPLLLLAGKHFSRYFSSSSVIYDKHENYYSSSSLKDISGLILRFMERFGARNLDGVVIVHPSHRESAVNISKSNNIALVPNYPYISDVDSGYIVDKIRSIDSASEFTMTYIGSLNWNSDRDIRTILFITEHLLSFFSNIKVVIGGATSDLKLQGEFDRLSRRFQERFVYVGFITPREIMRIHQESHMGFYMIKPDTDAWVASSSNKIYEYLSCGMIPILRTPQTDYDDFSSCSLIFRRDDSKEFILEKIKELLSDGEKIQHLMQAAFEQSKHHSFETVSSRYIELYDSVLK